MYGKFSSFSYNHAETEKENQQNKIKNKKEDIEKKYNKQKEEKIKLEKLVARKEKYDKYHDYMNNIDSIAELFKYENDILSWREKKELKPIYQDLIKEIEDYTGEEEAFEKVSKLIDTYIINKKDNLQSMIEKKERYIVKIKEHIEKQKEEVTKLEERLANYDLYMDYMDNPEKTSSLFTETSDSLTINEKKKLKEVFQHAQKNGSVMWQDVISFDNEWLEKHGILDKKTKTIDESKLKNATRLAMDEMLKREKMKHSAIWSAAIHFNTDNIHIHVATVEPVPTRTRGKRKPQTLSMMKSKVVNNIMDRSEEYKKINDLLRKNIVGEKKNISSLSNRKTKKLFLSILKELPNDRRQWNYNYHSISHLKPLIDEMSNIYIEKYHKEDFKALNEKLDREVKMMKEAYGEGTKEKRLYENFKKNKIDDLYVRLGNAFLKEMREYKEKSQMPYRVVREKPKASEKKNTREILRKNMSVHFSLKKLQRHFNNEYENWKNQMYYERLQQEIENANDYER
ncbi:MobP2 family relaxase [Margalitia sp. FSL K6-0131]|uniref:MobP2 family relaxase n=2 Tax=Margalitia sp. FSL K6-0131 TaxID=2954604 RepID=UPI0030F69E00